MLDTRHYRRDKQVTIIELLTEPEKYREILYSPTRKLLGPSQLDWLKEQMIKSTNPWQVLGNQVIMAKTQLPVSILINLNNEILLFESVTAYLTALNTPPENRTPEQNALLNPEINPLYGTNLDAWDGYPAEREKLYKIVEELNKNLIVLTGDSHNSWFNYLIDNSNNLVGKELAVTSVTSKGLESQFPNIPPAELQNLFETLFPDVKWIDTYRRGYLFSTYTKTSVVANWKFIDSVINMYYLESKPSHSEIITI
jgi:alkaline phosphatase D